MSENAHNTLPERHNNNVTPTHDSTSCKDLKMRESIPNIHKKVRNCRKTKTIIGYETAKTRKNAQKANYQINRCHI